MSCSDDVALAGLQPVPARHPPESSWFVIGCVGILVEGQFGLLCAGVSGVATGRACTARAGRGSDELGAAARAGEDVFLVREDAVAGRGPLEEIVSASAGGGTQPRWWLGLNVWLRRPAAVLAEQQIRWWWRCPLQDFLEFEAVSSGRGGESWPAEGAAFGGRLAEAGVQVGRLEVVRLGEAGDEGLGPLARAGEDLDGQLSDRPFEIVHRVAFLGWGAWVLAVTSRGTASSSARVIFSVPVRMASIAAPRIWWERAPIMPPVRSWR